MSSILPTEPITKKVVNPRRLVIFSQPKVGKTELASKLPNSLLIDVEDGSEFLTSSIRINVIQEAIKRDKHPITILKQIREELSKGDTTYDYITIDTATGLENMAKELALILYKKSPVGANFMGDDVLLLPRGAGYMWLRHAFDKLYTSFSPYAKKCLVLLAHIRASSVTKDGKDVSARDLDLTGKLKQITCSQSDAIGYMYRDPDSGKNILSFESSENDLATGARPPHLRNKQFIISEEVEGEIVTYWNKVFI